MTQLNDQDIEEGDLGNGNKGGIFWGQEDRHRNLVKKAKDLFDKLKMEGLSEEAEQVRQAIYCAINKFKDFMSIRNRPEYPSWNVQQIIASLKKSQENLERLINSLKRSHHYDD